MENIPNGSSLVPDSQPITKRRPEAGDETKMEEAVCGGDLEQVQRLIRSGVGVNTPPQGKVSLLTVAITRGYQVIALALLAAGADVRVKDTSGWTALHWASSIGREDVVQALIDRGSKVNERTPNGHTPIMLAQRAGGNKVAIAMCLLRAGASCEGLTEEQADELLHCATSDLSVVRVLLKYGCSVSVLSREEQEELLCHACHEGDVFVVEGLLAVGCNVNCVGADGCTPLIVAVKAGYKQVALVLMKKGADVHAKDRDRRTALHWACVRNLKEIVRLLIVQGSQVNEEDSLSHTPLELAQKRGNEALSMLLLRAGANCKGLRDEQINFLYEHAFNVGDKLAIQTLLNNHCKLSSHKQEELLHRACREGVVLIVEVVITMGCSVNCIDAAGSTPLMVAAHKGHEEVVKKLILAGAKVDMQNRSGDTALHIAANCNVIQCGILLAEGGASVRTKNKLSLTPLDLASTVFREAINEALSFTARKVLCVVGNAEGGKSTLIAALQAENNSVLGKMMNRFKIVTDRRQRTAGIEIILHSSQKYGEVVFFDFAGQHEYHGPHQMFLESLLSKPGVSMTLLLVVKVTEEEEAILHQLHRWLSPVALMSTTASPPCVYVIGSFLDKMKSKQEATAKVTRCIEITREDYEELPLKFVGSCFLNCRQPQSEGINQLCHFLQEIPIPEFRATHTQYSLAWVLSQIRSSFSRQPVQLQEFSTWVQHNKCNLPRTMPTPEEVCQDLSAAGHALYLPNREDSLKSWLVLDLPSILHDVYGTLFSQSKEIVNEFGLLHCQHLAKLFPHLDVKIVQQLLISLEFCIPVNPAVLKVELSRLTQSEETSGWLFFPALISVKPPQPNSESFPQQNLCYLCWQLRTSRKHSISAHVLQTILLRLAAHFVVKHHAEDGFLQHCCSIWWNGIAWQSIIGDEVTVNITNRVIQVFGSSRASSDMSCQFLTDVISDIVLTVHRLSPKLAADSYIVHPPTPALSENITTLSPQQLFPLAGIRHSIQDCEEFTCSLRNSENHWNKTRVADLFGGYIPSLEDVERINWTQLEPSQLDLHTEGSGTCIDSEQIPSRLGIQALLDISSTPDMRDVDELVVTPVAPNWQRLALRLGVEGCVSEVVLKNHPNDCEGACREMLKRWLRGERHTGKEERAWSTLLTALGRAGFVALERSLRRVHFIMRINWTQSELGQPQLSAEPGKPQSQTGPKQHSHLSQTVYCEFSLQNYTQSRVTSLLIAQYLLSN